MQTLEFYLREFLSSDHPYRKGQVCPFMKKVLADDQLILEKVDAVNRNYFQQISFFFEKFCIQTEKSVLVIKFPDNFTTRDAKKIAKKMRIRAALCGYMIGGFGPEDNTPSLYNHDFFPFRPDCVILVVRIMVPHDKQFFSMASFIVRTAMRLGYKRRYQRA